MSSLLGSSALQRAKAYAERGEGWIQAHQKTVLAVLPSPFLMCVIGVLIIGALCIVEVIVILTTSPVFAAASQITDPRTALMLHYVYQGTPYALQNPSPGVDFWNTYGTPIVGTIVGGLGGVFGGYVKKKLFGQEDPKDPKPPGEVDKLLSKANSPKANQAIVAAAAGKTPTETAIQLVNAENEIVPAVQEKSQRSLFGRFVDTIINMPLPVLPESPSQDQAIELNDMSTSGDRSASTGDTQPATRTSAPPVADLPAAGPAPEIR